MSGSMHSRVSFDEYLTIDALNISWLTVLARSPLHFKHERICPSRTRPMTLGVAAHCAALEPERFAHQFAVWDRVTETGRAAPRNGKAWLEFAAANSRRDIITADERDLAVAMATAIRNDPVARPYLEAGDPEVTMQWEMEGRRCKGRVDWICRDPKDDGQRVLVGLKTARDGRPFPFASAAAKLGYPLQWSWYYNGFKLINTDARKVRMVEIVVESAAPHAVVVYFINDDILYAGEERYQCLLAKLAWCEKNNLWPGPATTEMELTLPEWYYGAGRADDISDLGLE